MNIAVYCGGSLGNKDIYQETAVKLGKWFGTHNYDLVYGGGKVGLMGVLATEVLKQGQNAIGVMPQFLVDKEIAFEDLTELVIVEDMHIRKKKMIDLSQAYIALPGGPGTLEEISEVISWARIGQHQNPCILYNVDGYYNSLKTIFETMVHEGFLTQEDLDAILFSDNLDEIYTFIRDFKPTEVRVYAK